MADKKSKPKTAPESKPAAASAKYQATEKEQSALRDFAARWAKAPPAPRLKVSKDGPTVTVGPDHPDKASAFALLGQAFGSSNFEFVNGLIRQLVNAGSLQREADEEGLNFLLSIVTGVKPRDEMEAMLAAQMAAIHSATMTFARRLAHVELCRSRTAPSAHSISSREPTRCKWRL
jgi:hypothetical protein